MTFFDVRSAAHQWCQSYLESRQQYVCVGKATLDSVSVDFSVQKGSVLGQQLFTLHIYPTERNHPAS